MDELKVSCNDGTCKLIPKKCQKESYHDDVKFHMTPNALSSAVR